jgi:GDP/UDP-N,N'-diacetylbacillosamine 2-epimerase (hydrolysing)
LKRKIVVITGTRAEYGILKPLLKEINKSQKMELHLIVTGMHLIKSYGLTINEIQKEFPVFKKVKMYDEKISQSKYHTHALSKGIKNFSDILLKIKPQLVIVFGDRLEVLAASLPSAILGIHLAHIQGGDKTDSGHIDENIRHAISQFANIHFTATKNHTNRLIQMGQEPHTIFEVGSLGIDSIVKQKFIPKKKLFCELKLKNDKIIVCLFHPIYLEFKTVGIQMNEILKALAETGIQVVIIYPNNDKGSKKIISIIQKFSNNPNFKIFKNIPHEKFLSLLNYSEVLIGNSSSGMIESSSLKIPVINIGTRNTGRVHAKNVIFAKPTKNEILKSIKFTLENKKFRKQVSKSKNPYGDGNTSKKILKIISSIKLDKKLLIKNTTIR